jgi:pimeloyl-ACP methyl ester carboxylesterase
MSEVLEPSTDVRMALAVLERVMKEYPVDPKRIYVTGYSQGGFGTWNMALLRPELFAAIVPIAGGGDPALVSRIKDLPVWGFQAEDEQGHRGRLHPGNDGSASAHRCAATLYRIAVGHLLRSQRALVVGVRLSQRGDARVAVLPRPGAEGSRPEGRR